MEKLEKTLKELNNENLYKILHLEKTNDVEIIKRAYKKMIKRHHPDKNKEKNTVDTFERILKSYEILQNLELKALYDSYLDRKEEKSKRVKLFSEKRKKFADDLKKREEDLDLTHGKKSSNNEFLNRNKNRPYREEMAPPLIKTKTFEEKLSLSGIKIKWSKDSQLIFTKETIYSYFKDFGSIEDIVIKEDENKAYILFLSAKSVCNLFNSLNDNRVLNQLFKIKKIEKKSIPQDNKFKSAFFDSSTLNVIMNMKLKSNVEFMSKNETKNGEDKEKNNIDLSSNIEMTLEDFEKQAFDKLKLKFKSK